MPVDLRILHTLRCIGASSAARLGEVTGLAVADLESHLIDLGVKGLVARSGGGWSVTPEGKRVDNEAVAQELDDSGCRTAVEAAYGRFERLNPLALEACTAWQLREIDGVRRVNDHLDRRYDTQVLRKLGNVERLGQEVCNDLTAVLDRFDGYGDRLAEAAKRALGGEWEFVSEHPDSFHNIWFQLHEDLLVTIGKPRT